MSLARRLGPFSLLLPSLLLAAACEDPPSREMNQAQGVIDAARAAGADQYAADEYNAAVESLAKSREAAEQRDYRLALNFALDAHERGQLAARSAADQKALIRSEADRLLQSAETAVELVTSRLAAARTARVAAADLSRFGARIDIEQAAIEAARNRLEADDLRAARSALRPAVERLEQLTSEIDAAITARQPRRPARR
jgi:hypothetical protein